MSEPHSDLLPKAQTNVITPTEPGTASVFAPQPEFSMERALGNQGFGAMLSGFGYPPPGPTTKTLADRQVRKITLKKAERVLEFVLGDLSIQTERVLLYVDVPPNTYLARTSPARPLAWESPEELTQYLRESGRRSLVVTETADRAKNTGTFDGVRTFAFEVVGERVEHLVQTGDPELDAVLDSPEMRRYLALGRRRRRIPVRGETGSGTLRLDEIVAIRRVHDQLTQLTEADWARLATQAESATEAGNWVEAGDRLGHYLRGSDRAAAMAAEVTRDEQITTAHAGIDLDRQRRAISALSGTKDLYRAIRGYEHPLRDPDTGMLEPDSRMVPVLQSMYADDVERQLAKTAFDSTDAFDAAVGELREVVQRQAMVIALTTLRDSERILRAEQARYRSREVVNQLATELNALARPDVARDGIIRYRILDRYPIMRDPAVFKGAQTSGWPENLGELLAQNTEAQLRNVLKSREALHDDPDIVFSFDLVIGQVLEQMGLPRTSVQARLIRDGRGAPTHPVRQVIDMLLLVLSFASLAAGPIGWIGYLAGLSSFVLTNYDLWELQTRLNSVNAAAHAGIPLATVPTNPFGALEAVFYLWGALGVFQFPRPKGPPGEGTAMTKVPPERDPGGGAGGPGGGEPGGPGRTALPGGNTALILLEPGLEARPVTPGVVDISHPGRPGVLRITPDGWAVHPDPASGAVLAEPWVNGAMPPVPAQLLEQAPFLASTRDVATVSLGGKAFGVGVTADGWFVFAPGTRTPVLSGRFGPRAAPAGAGPRLALPETTAAPVATPPGTAPTRPPGSAGAGGGATQPPGPGQPGGSSSGSTPTPTSATEPFTAGTRPPGRDVPGPRPTRTQDPAPRDPVPQIAAPQDPAPQSPAPQGPAPQSPAPRGTGTRSMGSQSPAPPGRAPQDPAPQSTETQATDRRPTPTPGRAPAPGRLLAGLPDEFLANRISQVANQTTPTLERFSGFTPVREIGGPKDRKNGINVKYILKDQHGDEWMFKPADTEASMHLGPPLGIRQGERYRRAAAAAFIAGQLGVETPAVRLGMWNGMKGSLQQWREGYTKGEEFRTDSPARFDEFRASQQRKDLDVMDYLIAEQDRHPGNIMLRDNGRTGFDLLAIDQETSFPNSGARFDPRKPVADLERWQRPLPDSISKGLADRVRQLDADWPEADLRQWLTKPEVDGARSRLTEIITGLDNGTIKVAP